MDDLVPNAGGDAPVERLAGDAVAHQSIDETSIEVVAGSDGAHRTGLDDGETLLDAACGAQFDILRPVGADEVLAIERHLGTVDFVGVFLVVEHAEVVDTAAHEVGILEVLE